MISSLISQIRRQRPLIHNISNYVVMNFTANGLLALGASPVMAHAPEEVEEMTLLSKALVINIGTLSSPWVESMKKSMTIAKKNQIPIVLDPVGAGATSYRTQICRNFIETFEPDVIRGNASEIAALASNIHNTKGVDSTLPAQSALDAAKTLHEKFGSVIGISGQVDYVVGQKELKIHGGHPWMSQTTGMGCLSSTMIAAFLAVDMERFEACHFAMDLMKRCGEQASQKACGVGSFQVEFLNELQSFGA